MHSPNALVIPMHAEPEVLLLLVLTPVLLKASGLGCS